MKARNEMMDIGKAIAAYAVVFIHYGTEYFSLYFKALATFAIPFFCMISGYFAKDGNLKRKVAHLCKVYLCGEIIYFFHMWIQSGHVVRSTLFSKSFPVDWIIHTKPFYFGAGWYILAMIEMYLLYALLKRYTMKLWIRVLMIIALLYLFVLQKAQAFGVLTFFDIGVSRVFPFFMLGAIIREKEDAICARMKEKVCVIVICIGALMTLAERYIYNVYTDRAFSLYVGSILITIFLFVFCVIKKENDKMPLLIYIGRNLSMYIYVLHVGIYQTLQKVGLYVDILWVCAIVTIVAWFLHVIIQGRSLKKYKQIQSSLQQ